MTGAKSGSFLGNVTRIVDDVGKLDELGLPGGASEPPSAQGHARFAIAFLGIREPIDELCHLMTESAHDVLQAGRRVFDNVVGVGGRENMFVIDSMIAQQADDGLQMDNVRLVRVLALLSGVLLRRVTAGVLDDVHG